MKKTNRTTALISDVALALAASQAAAQDWPQWRGPNRDAKAAGFAAPKTWPKELNQKWKVTVGEGVATPALAGDKLCVFSRANGNEVTRCLEAASGEALWVDQYESLGASGSARGFSGPRCLPIVADGKVVTLGVRGRISCVDAATGKTDLSHGNAFCGKVGFYPIGKNRARAEHVVVKLVEPTSEIRKIAFLGVSLPRKCGIETFASDVRFVLAAEHLVPGYAS